MGSSSWTLVRLGEFVKVMHGFAFSTRYAYDERSPYALFTRKNVAIGGGFREGAPRYFHGDFDERFVLEPGDLMLVLTDLSKAGDLLGLPAVVPGNAEIRYLQNQRIGKVVLLSEDIDKDYLYALFRSPDYRRHVLSTATQTTVRDTAPSRLHDYRYRMPTLVEQRAIASVLRALDDKIASNRRVADSADEAWLARARAAFRGGTAVQVSELISAGHLIVNDGYRAKNAELAPEGVPFIRAGNLTDDGLQLDGADRVPPEVVLRAGIKVAAPWDTAFTSKGTVGRMTLVGPAPASFVYSPQVCFWRSTDPEQLSPFVVHAWMRSNRFRAQVDAVKGQTDMADYVSLRDQRAMEFDLPTSETQDDVAQFAEPLARLAAAQRAEALTLADLRDALLPKLVSGQIRVPLSDDSDEALGAAVEAHGLQEAQAR